MRVGAGLLSVLLVLGSSAAPGQDRDALLEQLRDGAAAQRAEAARILGRTRNRYFLEVLLGALRDPEAVVRSAAAEALAGQASPKAAVALAGALDDPDPAVRRSAGTALRSRNSTRDHSSSGAKAGPARPAPVPRSSIDLDCGFEDVEIGSHPGVRGWATYLAGKSGTVTEEVAHGGRRSFRLESRPHLPRCEALTLPLDLDRVRCELAILVDPVPGRWVRVGFVAPMRPDARTGAPGRVRAFNHFRIDSGAGDLAAITFRGTGRAPVEVGSAPKAGWIVLRVDYDLRSRVADLFLGGKRVVTATPIRPRTFRAPRGRIVLRQWGVGQGRWAGGPPGVVHIDDVRVLVPPLTAEQIARERGRHGERLAHPGGPTRARAVTDLARLGGEEVVGPILALRKDPEFRVRIAVCRALGGLPGDAAFEALTEALRDENGPVRRAAATALGTRGDPRCVPPLIASLSDGDDLVRRAAAEALGKLRDERAIESLLALLGSEDHRNHETAALALVPFGDRVILGLVTLFDRRPEPGSWAASALARIGARSVDAVRRFADDERREARCGVAWLLGRTGEVAATEPLVKLTADPEPSVRSMAFEALAAIPGDRAFAAIRTGLDAGDVRDRMMAVRALGASEDPRAEALLEPLLRDARFEFRSAAARSLGKTSWIPERRSDWIWFLVGQGRHAEAAALGVDALEPLIAAVRDGDRRSKSEALRAVARIGEPAIAPLVEVRARSSADVRREIARTLTALGWKPESVDEDIGMLIDARRWDDIVARGPVAVAPLIRALRSGSGPVREGAAGALTRLGWKPESDEQRAYLLAARGKIDEAKALGKAAVEALCLTLEGCGGKSSMPAFAASALGDLGDLRAVEPLCEALRKAPMDGQQEAALALAKLGDRRAVPSLIAALRDQELRVHAYAAVALGELGDRSALEPLERRYEDAAKLAALEFENVRGDHMGAAFLVHARMIRCSIAAALFRLGRRNMLEPVIGALDDDVPAVRAWAARMVERLGTDARAAVPALVRMERSDHHRLARAALRALHAVRPRTPVDAVVLREKIDGAPFVTFRKGMSWTYSVRSPGYRMVARMAVLGVFEDGRIAIDCDLPDRVPFFDARMWRASGSVLTWEMESFGHLACVVPGARVGAGWASRLFGIRCASRIVGTEAVETPAGSFPSCLLVEHEFPEEPMILRQWWAKGVGLVRLRLVAEEGSKEGIEWILTAYTPHGK